MRKRTTACRSMQHSTDRSTHNLQIHDRYRYHPPKREERKDVFGVIFVKKKCCNIPRTSKYTSIEKTMAYNNLKNISTWWQ